MRGDAFIEVECDKCETFKRIELTALARSGSWDERNVKDDLCRMGWHAEGDADYCPDCWAEMHPEEGEDEEEGGTDGN